jgi:hypothetical protein
MRNGWARLLTLFRRGGVSGRDQASDGACNQASEEGKEGSDMRKFRLLGLMLLAVFAFGAVAAMSASAVEFLLAEWLAAGVSVTGELLVQSPGELLLESSPPLIGKVDVLCSGILDGFLLENGEDLITEVLSLGGVATGTPLTGTAIACTNVEKCPEPLVWPVHLPWLTLLELMEDPAGTSFFVVLILPDGAGNPGWEVECMIGGASEECTSPEGVFEVMNETTTSTALFSEAITELAGLKLANCTVAGNEKGIVEGEGLIEDPAGGNPITASSTG